MITVRYPARVLYTTGTLIGESVEYFIPLTELSPKYMTQRSTSIALSGRQQNTVSRRDVFYSCRTDLIQEGTDEFNNIKQFLDSSDFGDRFDVSVESLNLNTNVKSAILTENYTQERDGQLNCYFFGFKFRILP